MSSLKTTDPHARARALAADYLDPAASKIVRYRDDPVAFVHDCIRWPAGKALTPYQDDTLALLLEHKRVAVRGPHGLGKTADSALAVLWFACTREAAGEDWKIPTTASVWRQLTHFLWPEIRKWARLLDWAKLERSPFTRMELQQLNLKLRHGEAFAVASDDPAAIEGAHAEQILYIFDEAKTIPAATFDAAEGAFSGAGRDTAAEAYALATSTPGEPAGRFFDIHKRRAGLEDWHAVHITLDDAVAAGRVSRDWAEQRAKQWGVTSAVYANRVLGEFHSSDDDAVIPLGWVEAANERWRHIFEMDGTPVLPNFDAVGVDVSTTGGDRTVLALRYGHVIAELREQPVADTMPTVGVTAGILDTHGGGAVVDVIGVGAGVVDRLRERGYSVVGFNAAHGVPGLVDRSGELGFVNKRAAAWWAVREALDPAFAPVLALPPDDRLIGDLTAPHWRVMSSGRILVESKDDIRKRLGRSTDDGDAVVQACWRELAPRDEIIYSEDIDSFERVEISAY